MINYKTFINKQITEWLQDLNNLDYTSSQKLDVINIVDCDFVNYKEPTFIILSGTSCTFKCDNENNCKLCQNSHLAREPVINTTIEQCIKMYNNQDIARSITLQGLEPLDNLKQMLWFIYYFRKISSAPIIIWTGYTKEECFDLILLIQKTLNWKNIIMKYGRFIPNQKPHQDPILGVSLASDNQYAEIL